MAVGGTRRVNARLVREVVACRRRTIFFRAHNSLHFRALSLIVEHLNTDKVARVGFEACEVVAL